MSFECHLLEGTEHSWRSLTSDREPLAEAARSCVERWEYATDTADWEGPYLLQTERNGDRRPAGPMKSEPTNWFRTTRYGRNASGDVVFAEGFSVMRGVRTVARQTFWIAVGEQRCQVRFLLPPDEPPYLQQIILPRYRDGRLDDVHTWGGRYECEGVHEERYEYVGERLAEIRGSYRSADRSWTKVEHVRYDEDGVLQGIFASNPERGDVPRPTWVRASSRDERRASQRLEVALVDAIVAWHTRRSTTHPIKVVLLLYGRAPDDVLPPGLAGLTPEDFNPRAGWDRAFDPVNDMLLDAASAELEDEQLLSDCASLNARWRSTGRHAEPRKLLVAVAGRAASELPALAGEPVWVVPVDHEHLDLHANLTALLPRSLVVDPAG